MKKQKLSIFQITAIILTAILFVFIIVTMGIIIDINKKTKNLEDENDKISQSIIINQIL